MGPDLQDNQQDHPETKIVVGGRRPTWWDTAKRRLWPDGMGLKRQIFTFVALFALLAFLGGGAVFAYKYLHKSSGSLSVAGENAGDDLMVDANGNGKPDDSHLAPPFQGSCFVRND